VGTYIIYPIDKGLGITPREAFDHLNLVIIQEYCRNQRCALVPGGGLVGQLLPDWLFATYKKTVRLAGVLLPKEILMRLTG